MAVTVNYIPLINNLTNPTFGGLVAKPGETPEHLAKRPSLLRMNGKKALYLCIGASTPGQISTVLEQLSSPLKDTKIVNACTGAQDINDWLDPLGIAWSNLDDDLVRIGYEYSEVQGIIMCHDDLKDSSTAFPLAPQSLANKMESLVKLAKSKFVNLRVVELFSRLCEYKITDLKFATPSGYQNQWANKFLTEKAISYGGYIDGVWVSDGVGNLWTDGEKLRSDGFQFRFAWMKQGQTSVHLDTRKEGDNICAQYIFDRLKRYPDFK